MPDSAAFDKAGRRHTRQTRRERIAERTAEAQKAEAAAQRRARASRRARRTISRVRGKVPPDWRENFLKNLAVTGTVTTACEYAGVSRAFVYDRRSRLPAFGRLWDAAIDRAVEAAEAELRRRGVEGTMRPVYGKLPGEKTGTGLVGHMREQDTNALIAYLKAHRPEKYKERYEVQNLDKMSEVDREILDLAKQLSQNAGNAPVPTE